MRSRIGRRMRFPAFVRLVPVFICVSGLVLVAPDFAILPRLGQTERKSARVPLEPGASAARKRRKRLARARRTANTRTARRNVVRAQLRMLLRRRGSTSEARQTLALRAGCVWLSTRGRSVLRWR